MGHSCLYLWDLKSRLNSFVSVSKCVGHSCLYLWDLKSHLVKRNSAKTKGVQVQPLALLEYAPVTEEYIYLSSFKGNLTSAVLHFSLSKVNTSFLRYEPPRGKTSYVISIQVRHKPAFTSTEKS